VSLTTQTHPAQRDIDGLAVIGRTKHALMGIRYEEGEGGDNAAAQAAAAAAAATAGSGAGAGASTVDELPEWAKKEIKDLRTEAASNRTSNKDLSDKLEKLTTGLAGALGLGEQQETDPAKLQASVVELSSKIGEKDTALTQAQSDIKARDLYIEVATAAHPLGANPKLLLKNQEFLTSIASVDPTDEAAITAKITAAIQANAALKATPGSSGSDGHQGGQAADLKVQLAAAEKAGDHSTSISLKRRIAALANH